MSTPYLGEIRLFAGNFAPYGWAFCDGSVIPIANNDALFNLIGTTFGGDGQTNFALPDLQGRVPIHMGARPGGSSYALGQNGGSEQVTVTTQQIPSHTHALAASTAPGAAVSPQAALLGAASDTALELYSANAPNQSLNAAAVGSAGSGQPHENRQPFVALSFIIAITGVFPSQV